jgi:hypothetical protein
MLLTCIMFQALKRYRQQQLKWSSRYQPQDTSHPDISHITHISITSHPDISHKTHHIQISATSHTYPSHHISRYQPPDTSPARLPRINADTAASSVSLFCASLIFTLKTTITRYYAHSTLVSVFSTESFQCQLALQQSSGSRACLRLVRRKGHALRLLYVQIRS